MWYVGSCATGIAGTEMADPPQNGGGEWQFAPYIQPSGRCQVFDFLDGLREKDYAAFAAFQDVLLPEMLARGPFEVGGRYWTALGRGYYEIRFASRQRIYCTLHGRRCVMMLIGRTKRWRTWESADQKFCEQASADIESGSYDQEQREYLYRDHCQRRGKKWP